jgi:ribosome-associated protein
MSNQDPIAIASRAAEDKKAQDVKTLDISSNSSFADYFVLATGLNKVHTRAVADSIEDELAEQGIHPYSKQGYQQGDWILLDYLDFVVHVFVPEAREFYQLERLWQKT